MSLRRACGSFNPARRPLMLQWPKLQQTSAHLAGMWSDRPERKLPPFQLDEFVASVEDAWRAGKNLESLSGREGKWLPHVVFHPEADRKAWLARDSRLMEAALARIKQRPGSMRALLKNVFRLWPTELEAAPVIWRTLSSQLLIATSPKLREWNRRVQQYDLLREDGPERFARLLRSGKRSRAEVTEDAGLVAELSQSGFLAAVDRVIVRTLKAELEGKDFSGLDAALHLIAPSGTLTFKAEAGGVAEALLAPFVRQAPPKAVQEKITNFLLKHLHDPRSTQVGWTGVSQQARGVMLRWLVEVSLEQFFDLIGRWAHVEHWSYREAFWSAYHKRGYLDSAWVVLGIRAEEEARRRWRGEAPAHGRLIGGAADHCVLMLQIGDLTVAEWSHNGACRVWRASNKHRPALYDNEYTQHRLQADPDGSQRHSGNLNYVWQQKLAETIREETGRAVSQRDYRVK